MKKAAEQERPSRANVAAAPVGTRRHPKPKPRPCACCGEEFSPPGWLVARGGGKFCSRDCSDAAKAVYPDPEPRPCKRCGTVFTPLRNQASGKRGHYCSRSCSNKHHAIHPEPEPRPCAQCGETFTPTAGNVAKGWGRYCSHACVDEAKRIYPAVPERTCARPGCGRTFTPPGWLVAKGYGLYCGSVCWGLDRWHTGRISRAFVAELPARARQQCLGRWAGRVAGHLGGRPRGYSDEHVRLVLLLRERDPGIGRARLSRLTNLSEKQVRAILSEKG